MSNKPLNFSHPEKHSMWLESQPTQNELLRATDLGEQHRSLKKKLKSINENKKALSRKVADAKISGKSPGGLIEKIRELKFDIAQTKAQLKSVEQSIVDLIATPIEEPPTYTSPPQFNDNCTVNTSAIGPVAVYQCDDEEAWESYIQRHPQASIYHSLNIRDVITHSFKHSTLYLFAKDEQNIVRGVLPLIRLQSRLFGDFFSSIPFFNYGGVLADTPDIAKQLIFTAKSLIRPMGCQHIEYRHCHNIYDLPCRNDKVAMLLSLPASTEQLWQKIGSKLRAQIKKAQRYNTRIVTGKTELIDDFYKVFAANMRDLGTPVYGKDLFVNMLNINSTANITVVYLDEKPVSAGFTLGWRNTLEIPWASTLKKVNKYNINMLLYWHILEFAINKNYKVFDFGRSSKDGPTHRFKKQWGATEQPLYWHYWLADGGELPKLNPNNPKFQLAVAIWKKLPLAIANQLGPRLVKYLP